MARFFVQDLGLALAPKRAPNEQSFKTAKIIVRRFCRETLLFFFSIFFLDKPYPKARQHRVRANIPRSDGVRPILFTQN